jgi:hypothetical protein
MKDLPWFTTKGQVAQLIAAVLGCTIAGSAAWQKIKDNELLAPGPILFFVLVVIVVLSVALLLYSRYNMTVLPPSSLPEDADVRVINPLGKVRTTTDKDGTRRFEVEGTLKQLPVDIEIWAFVKDVSLPRWWPHGPAVVHGLNWTISRVNPGSGEKVKLQVYLVGKSGQALIAYYRSVGNVMRQLKAEVTKQSPSLNTDEFRPPAITYLGSDMTFVFDKLLPVE